MPLSALASTLLIICSFFMRNGCRKPAHTQERMFLEMILCRLISVGKACSKAMRYRCMENDEQRMPYLSNGFSCEMRLWIVLSQCVYICIPDLYCVQEGKGLFFEC